MTDRHRSHPRNWKQSCVHFSLHSSSWSAACPAWSLSELLTTAPSCGLISLLHTGSFLIRGASSQCQHIRAVNSEKIIERVRYKNCQGRRLLSPSIRTPVRLLVTGRQRPGAQALCTSSEVYTEEEYAICFQYIPFVSVFVSDVLPTGRAL